MGPPSTNLRRQPFQYMEYACPFVSHNVGDDQGPLPTQTKRSFHEMVFGRWPETVKEWVIDPLSLALEPSAGMKVLPVLFAGPVVEYIRRGGVLCRQPSATSLKRAQVRWGVLLDWGDA